MMAAGSAEAIDIAVKIRQELRQLLGSPKVAINERAKICLEIELALSDPVFDGLPLGSTLTDHLSGLVYSKRQTPGWGGRAFKGLVSTCVHRFRGVEPPPAGFRFPREENGKILVALISNRPYHRQWVPEFLQRLGPDQCHLITTRSGFDLPGGLVVSKWNEMPQVKMEVWREARRRPGQQWKNSLSRLGKKLELTASVQRVLLDGMIVASYRIRRFGAFLDAVRPSAILVEYDRNTRGSCLVLAARSRGIPTFTLLHGAINGPFGYTPVLADYVLCWGDIQKRQLIDLGTAEERIGVVGFERLEPGLRADRKQVRGGLGLGLEGFVAMLATNPIQVSDTRRLAEAFCEGLGRAGGAKGIVRLHPAEELRTYEPVMHKFPNVRFLANDERSQDEVLAASDVVVVHSSGFGSEAMAKGKFCIVLDVIGAPLGHGEDLLRFGGVSKASSAEELSAFLRKMRDDSDFREGLEESRRRFVREMYAAFGSDAVTNIAKAVAGKVMTSSESCGQPAVVFPGSRVGRQ